MKKETARENKKQYVLRHTKEKLKQLESVRMTPKKKNLVKKLKTLLKWNLRSSHAPKRNKGIESDKRKTLDN